VRIWCSPRHQTGTLISSLLDPPTHRRQEVPGDEVIEPPIRVSDLVSGGTAHGRDGRVIASIRASAGGGGGGRRCEMRGENEMIGVLNFSCC